MIGEAPQKIVEKRDEEGKSIQGVEVEEEKKELKYQNKNRIITLTKKRMKVLKFNNNLTNILES